MAHGNPTAVPSILTLAPMGRTIFAMDSVTSPVLMTVRMVIGSVAAWGEVKIERGRERE
jgi:hypothetical protein